MHFFRRIWLIFVISVLAVNLAWASLPPQQGSAVTSGASKKASNLPISGASKLVTSTFSQSSGYYAAPYYDSYPSISSAVSAWWTTWQSLASPPYNTVCTYTLALNPHGWIAAVATMNSPCSGSQAFYATYSSYQPGKNLGKPCNCAGDPIDVGTGNEYRDDSDASLGVLSFSRYYNSHIATASSHIGAHWRHSFDRKLEYLSDGTTSIVTAFRQTGLEVAFNLQSGQWVTDSDVADRLTKQTDASGNLTGWFYFDASTRDQESYNAQGNLLSITDTNGLVTTLTYSTTSTPTSVAPFAGLLLTVTDQRGRSLHFTYNAQANIATITQPDGGVLSYGYDASSNLIKVTYPDASFKQYVYNESTLTTNTSLPHALTGEIDETQTRFGDIGYDTTGRAILSRQAGGADLTQVAYNNDGSTTVTYPSGVQTTLGFVVPNGLVRANTVSVPCGPGCGQPNKSATFDSNGYPATHTDFNNVVTATTYDANGLLDQQVDAQGTANQRTTTTQWDTVNRVPQLRTVADNTGAIQAKTTWVYNSRAQAIARCDIDPSVSAASSYTCATTGTPPSGVRRTTSTYCDAVDTTQCPLIGLLLSTTGPRTDVTDLTQYSYYLSTDESACGTPGGACHRAGDLYQVTDALGHVSTVVAYDKNGRVVRQRDANGVITDLTYHPRGWLLTRTVRANADGSASAGDALTQIAYDATGNV
ncbi:DUF6531 domain-containing protein, partial [Dyella silvatica]|uniref:DUF6531 domain-containing protein n=1 Tax=Dyella silvatica TaxID=2992128 RepID=UPI002B1CC400